MRIGKVKPTEPAFETMIEAGGHAKYVYRGLATTPHGKSFQYGLVFVRVDPNHMGMLFVASEADDPKFDQLLKQAIDAGVR
jgi:hypothetical protein